MKNILTSIILFLSLVSYSQDPLVIPIENPAKPGTLNISLNSGSIRVIGHDRAEFIVTAIYEESKDSGEQTNQNGLKQLPNNSIDLSITNSDNRVDIQSRSAKGIKELIINAPFKCNIAIITRRNGNIIVESLDGNIDVTNNSGKITLTDIKGSVIASGGMPNSPISIDFLEFSESTPSSITSTNEKVSLTLPSSTKATLRLKATKGEIYSDLNLDLKSEQQKTSIGNSTSIDNWMIGKLNGGGQILTITTLHSDIHLIKNK
jgi:hypothetical protein